MSLVPQQFFPTSTRPELFVELRGPEGAAFALTDREAKKLEQMLAGDPDLEYFTTYVGGGAPRFQLGYNPALPNQNYALILVQTKGGEARERILHKLRDLFAENEGAVRGRVYRLELGPPIGHPVQFRVVGSDPEELRRIAAQVRETMRANKNTRDVEFEWGEKAKTVRLELDQDRIRLLGLNAQDLAATLQTLISGYEVTALREGTKIGGRGGARGRARAARPLAHRRPRGGLAQRPGDPGLAGGAHRVFRRGADRVAEEPRAHSHGALRRRRGPAGARRDRAADPGAEADRRRAAGRLSARAGRRL